MQEYRIAYSIEKKWCDKLNKENVCTTNRRWLMRGKNGLEKVTLYIEGLDHAENILS
jgi:hypothetical protein